jgi:hypothetical protein
VIGAVGGEYTSSAQVKPSETNVLGDFVFFGAKVGVVVNVPEAVVIPGGAV